MALELGFRVRSLTTLAIASLAIAAAKGAEAATYTEVITDNPSTFTCTTGGDLKTCFGYVFFFAPPPKGTGTLVSGSGAFVGKAGDTVNIDLIYSSPLHVPKGTGLGAGGFSTYNVAFNLLYLLNGLQLITADEPSSASSTVSGYVGPPGITLNETFTTSGAFVGFGGSFLTSPTAFSITGMDSTITLNDNLPYPVYEVAYGYQTTVPEPASWAVLLIGLGAVGAAIRMRRRRRPVRVDRTACHVA